MARTELAPGCCWRGFVQTSAWLPSERRDASHKTLSVTFREKGLHVSYLPALSSDIVPNLEFSAVLTPAPLGDVRFLPLVLGGSIGSDEGSRWCEGIYPSGSGSATRGPGSPLSSA